MEDWVQQDLSRNPPDHVKRQLRREVGLGCPVPDCRKPFLSFHHFDPPWAKEHHHRPEGMVALCVEHHDAADGGAFEKSYLRALKVSGCPAADVSARFAWARSKQLIRLGGYYSSPEGIETLRPVPRPSFPSLRKNSAGFLELTFSLQDAIGQTLAAMTDNMFSAVPARLSDLIVNTHQTAVTIKIKQKDVALALQSRLITLDKLESLLDEDWKRHRRFVAEQSKRNPKFRQNYLLTNPLLSGVIVEFGPGWARRRPPPPPVEVPPETFREFTKTSVMRYAESHLRDEEGQISVLDIRQYVTYVEKLKCEIRNGISVGGSGGTTLGNGYGSALMGEGTYIPAPR